MSTILKFNSDAKRSTKPLNASVPVVHNPTTGMPDHTQLNKVNQMSRHKKFDEEEVLEHALAMFWKNGYAATSIQNLVDQMKIHRSSLYTTFKDKKALFSRCLEHYDSKKGARLKTSLPPIETIRHWFQYIVEAGVSPEGPRGCFVVNTLKDTEIHDLEVRQAVKNSLQRTEDMLYAQIRRGQADGSIAQTLNARSTAQSMLGLTVGMRSLSHLKPDRSFLQNIADSAVSLIS